MNNNYLVVCPTKKMAVMLFKRLVDYLLKVDIRCRALMNIYVIEILGHEICVRFVSEEEYHEKVVGFHGWVVTGYQVEQWLDAAEVNND